MLALIRVELYKMLKRPRSYIGIVAVAIIVLLIQFAMYVDGSSYLSFLTQQMEQSFSIEGNIINGYLVAWLILQTMIIHLPLLVALISGDAISGEAASGTIRLLTSKPISRINLLLAKFFSNSIYTMVMIVWLGVLAVFVSVLIFKPGDLIVLNQEYVAILRSNDVFWRFMAAFLAAFVSLTVVSTLAMMLSCFTDNSIGPIVTTMTIIIIFTIIDTMEIPLFDRVRPWLFTTHMLVWRDFFQDPVPWNEIRNSIVIMLAHIAGFLGISFYYFNKKDILN